MGPSIHNFNQRIWELEHHVVALGMQNTNSFGLLSKDQIELLTHELSLVIKESEHIQDADTKTLKELKKILRWDLKSPLHNKECRANFIAQKLREIGVQTFQLSEHTAQLNAIAHSQPFKNDTTLPFLLELGSAIENGHHRKLQMLLRSNEFQRLDTTQLIKQSREFLFLPSLNWSQPQRLLEIFDLLCRDSGLMPESGWIPLPAMHDSGAAAAAAGAAEAAAGYSPYGRQRPKTSSEKRAEEERYEAFQSKVANLLAPTLFEDLIQTLKSNLSDENRRQNTHLRNLLTSSPLFLKISPAVFEIHVSKLIQGATPAGQLSPPLEILEEIYQLSRHYPKKFREHLLDSKPFLSQHQELIISPCFFDCFYHLIILTTKEGNPKEIDRLLNSLIFKDFDKIDFIRVIREASEKWTDKEKNNFPKLCTHPRWYTIHGISFKTAFFMTLVGNDYRVWQTLGRPDLMRDFSPHVDLNQLKGILEHPLFNQLDEPPKLLESLINPRLRSPFGYLPSFTPKVQNSLLKAILNHPFVDFSFVIRLLRTLGYDRWRALNQSSAIPKHLLETFKECTIGNAKTYTRVQELLVSSEILNIKNLIKAFNALTFESPFHQKVIANLLAPVFLNTLRDALIKEEWENVDILLESQLFSLMDQRDFHERFCAHFKDSKPSHQIDLLKTDSRWMNISGKAFSEGLNLYIREAQGLNLPEYPLDKQDQRRLKKALNCPLFLHTHAYAVDEKCKGLLLDPRVTQNRPVCEALLKGFLANPKLSISLFVKLFDTLHLKPKDGRQNRFDLEKRTLGNVSKEMQSVLEGLKDILFESPVYLSLTFEISQWIGEALNNEQHELASTLSQHPMISGGGSTLARNDIIIDKVFLAAIRSPHLVSTFLRSSANKMELFRLENLFKEAKAERVLLTNPLEKLAASSHMSEPRCLTEAPVHWATLIDCYQLEAQHIDHIVRCPDFKPHRFLVELAMRHVSSRGAQALWLKRLALANEAASVSS